MVIAQTSAVLGSPCIVMLVVTVNSYLSMNDIHLKFDRKITTWPYVILIF